jgi:hypothetical protein
VLGVFFLPRLPYTSNPVWEIKYFSNSTVMNAMGEWSKLFGDLYMANEKSYIPVQRT